MSKAFEDMKRELNYVESLSEEEKQEWIRKEKEHTLHDIFEDIFEMADVLYPGWDTLEG